MDLPVLVIIGRSNVGKSTLFNRILKKRLSVVVDREGVTRDLHYEDVMFGNRVFQVVDTGGFLTDCKTSIDEMVIEKVSIAIEAADSIIFVTDGKTGITNDDLTLSRKVKAHNKPVFLAVNKTESPSVKMDIQDFWRLGMGEPYAISALHGNGVTELVEAAVAGFSRGTETPFKAHDLKVAVLGRPNTGKSTLINKLLKENRQIVDAEAGTTRDSIDVELMHNGKKLILTDTAGLRKKARVQDDVEYYSSLRTHESIRNSDVCILLIDAERGLGIQDARILSMIHEAGKGVLLCINKWDLVKAESKTFDAVVRHLKEKVPEISWIPTISISGKSGKRLDRMLDTAFEVYQNLNRILGRDQVIDFFKEVVLKHPHPRSAKGNVKFEKCCQVGVNPVVLAVKVNRPELILPSYIRYLKNEALQYFKLGGVPLKFYFRTTLTLRKDEELQQFLELRAKMKEGTEVIA